METENDLMIENDGTNLTIKIPLELLVFVQSERLDLPLRITDTKKMAEWIVENIMYFNGEEEGSAWEKFFDAMFDNAYESGESWLEGIVLEK